MNMRFTLSQKILLATAFFLVAIIGFMIKLPSGFRHIDKELHAVFYFSAAALLNLFFSGRNVLRHLIVFIALYLFGMAIEYGQQYSNRFFRTRIHGRFDPEDLQWNLKGLIAFSLLWLLWMVVVWGYKRSGVKKREAKFS